MIARQEEQGDDGVDDPGEIERPALVQPAQQGDPDRQHQVGPGESHRVVAARAQHAAGLEDRERRRRAEQPRHGAHRGDVAPLGRTPQGIKDHSVEGHRDRRVKQYRIALRAGHQRFEGHAEPGHRPAVESNRLERPCQHDRRGDVRRPREPSAAGSVTENASTEKSHGERDQA